MKASVIAVIVNFCINYILIFGHFGFPKLGVIGAAIGTVISRVVEMGINVAAGYNNKYLRDAMRLDKISGDIFKNVVKEEFHYCVMKYCGRYP